MKPKVLIVIPAYNEEKNILDTIRNVQANSSYDYIVIEDKSQDNTLAVLQRNNIPYIQHDENKGLSEAIRTGMRYALEHDYDYVIQIDGDNQHDPKDIASFLQSAANQDVIVLGNRYQNNKKGWSLKALAQNYIAFWFKRRTGIWLNDPTNGMRLYGKTFMQTYVHNCNLCVEPSSIAFVIKTKNLSLFEVHTTVKERVNGRSMYHSRLKQLKYIQNEVKKLRTRNFRWAYLGLEKEEK